MTSPQRKLPLVALAVLAALALGACGDAAHEGDHRHLRRGVGRQRPVSERGAAEYEVQLSRELNPFDVEDSAYFEGLTPAQRKLEPGQEWFGVFMQVYNNTSHAHLASRQHDDQRHPEQRLRPDRARRDQPVRLPRRPRPRQNRLPELGTVAANGPTQGRCCCTRSRSSRSTTARSRSRSSTRPTPP